MMKLIKNISVLTFFVLGNTAQTQTLADLCTAAGFEFGSPFYALVDPDQENLLYTECGVATIMTYWKYTIHKEENIYSWEESDYAVSKADSLGIAMHGHPLVWGSDTHIPDWVLNKAPTDGELIMLDHVETVVSRYKGKITTWDVVNEAVEDDGSYRNSFWNRSMTAEFVIKAFRKAHQVDPDAQLLYNDYGIETNLDKFNTVKNLLGWLQSENVGLTGLGWQLHVHVDDVLDLAFPLEARMDDITDMGLKNFVTELDIRIDDNSPEELQKQKLAYQKILEIFLNNGTRGDYFQTWGLTDVNTWWNDFDTTQIHYPLPFDRSYTPKLAYWGMVETMATALDQNNPLGVFRLKNKGQEKYLNQSGDFIGATTNVQPLVNDWLSEQWTSTQGPDGTIRIQCNWRSWYLNAGNTVPGTTTNVHSYEPDWWSMMWIAEPLGNHQFRLRHRWSNLYLTGITADNTTLEMLVHDADNQVWIFEPLNGCLKNFIVAEDLNSGSTLNQSSQDWIKAFSTSAFNSNLILNSAQVELLPGFHAQVGSLLEVIIGGCGG